MYSLKQLTSNLTAFNAKQKLLSVALNNYIYIYSQDYKFIKIIDTNEGTIEKLYFVPDSTYLLSSTKSGRVMLYNYRNKPFGYRLYSFIKQKNRTKQNKMTCAAFKNKSIAIASSKGIIMILGLHSQEIQQKFRPTYSTISAMCFTTTNKLISAEVQGDIFIHKLDNSQLIQTIHTALYAIKQLLSIPYTEFIIVHTGTNKLALLDTKSSKVIDSNYMHFNKNIAYIGLTEENNLLVILVDKKIIEIQLQQAKEIHALILRNMIVEAYQLIEKKPWLRDTSEYNELEKIYFTQYLNATKALLNANVEKAHKIMDDYLLVENKKDNVTALFKAYKEYDRLINLSTEHKYAPAYALCDNYPALKYSPQYKNMELDFKSAYILAQKAIINNQYTQAKEYLIPYLTVISKKEIINLILKYNKDFLDFLGYINDKKYVDIDRLLLKYPIFHEIPPYITLQEQIQSTLQEIRNLLNATNTKEAMQKICELEDIPSLALDLKKLHVDVKAIEQLAKSYQENDFKHCYELLDENNHIFSELELNRLLENHWKKLIHKCEEYALQGNIRAIKETLGELITVKTRSKQIGELLRLSFRTEIDKNIEIVEYFTAQALIYSYIDIFGIDNELSLLMKKYEQISNTKLAITTHRTTRDNWVQNRLIVGDY